MEPRHTFLPGTLQLAPGYEWTCVAHPLEYGPESVDVVVQPVSPKP
jgi:hypothetical protein